MAEKTKIRIAILGLGAVGGYFGGFLAQAYARSKTIEIIFIARGKTQKHIQEAGLKILTPHFETIVFPDLTTNDPACIGLIDLLICAVKSYDLEESLLPLKNCIHSGTIILPLLNGVDAPERISKLFPTTAIWEGCVYLVARSILPGVVKETGNIHSLHFGSKTAAKEELKQMETLFRNANIETCLSETIEQTIWEKFLFISSLASLTSYLDLPVGEILKNLTHKKMLIGLLEELKSIADAKQISLPDTLIAKTIAKMESLPPETTSSMHSDFKKGGKTE